jgi:hypothetical protein
MIATARQLVEDALRLIGAIAAAEDAEEGELIDGMRTLNQMLEAWTLRRRNLYVNLTQNVPIPAGTATLSIGPSGGFVGVRPVQIDPASCFYDPAAQLNVPIALVNEAQFLSIPTPNTTSTYAQVVWYSPAMPNGIMSFWPVPTVPTTMRVVSVAQLTQFATLDQEIDFPPGYYRALRYNLAVDLATEYGTALSTIADVMKIAGASLGDIKVSNDPMDVMSFPNALTAQTRGWFNIYTGG